MKRNIIYIAIVLIFFLGLFLYFNVFKPKAIQAKCPESYPETDSGTKEYRNALIDWTTEFFKANPKAGISEWSMAKMKRWEYDNCTIALERSKLSGEVTDLKPWEKVDYEVQNSLDEAINSTK